MQLIFYYYSYFIWQKTLYIKVDHMQVLVGHLNANMSDGDV